MANIRCVKVSSRINMKHLRAASPFSFPLRKYDALDFHPASVSICASFSGSFGVHALFVVHKFECSASILAG